MMSAARLEELLFRSQAPDGSSARIRRGPLPYPLIAAILSQRSCWGHVKVNLSEREPGPAAECLNKGMSRAFLKEADGERWRPPPESAKYLVFTGRDRLELDRNPVYSDDDLVGALRWLDGRSRGYYQLRSQDGQLLAEIPG